MSPAMMKKKLGLGKETLRTISTRDLAVVAGGTMAGLVEAGVRDPHEQGFIMRDSVIVRTSGR